MKIGIVSFTRKGTAENRILKRALLEYGHRIEARAVSRFADGDEVLALECSVGDWSGLMFQTVDCMIFIGAAGIAVRSIAPFVEKKTKDPAVLVMDEKAEHVIPILSGHLGGANKMAETVSRITGAQPVITTATDIRQVFAVDLFAKDQNMAIRNPEQIKTVSAALLEGRQVGLYSDFPISGKLPEGLYPADIGQAGIVISISDKPEVVRDAVHLIPRIVYGGIGCRRDTAMECIEEQFFRMLKKAGTAMEAVAGLASIEDKKEEKGLIAFARTRGWEFICYSAEELRNVPGEFTSSEFVKKTVGVDNVCERSAGKAAGYGPMLCEKYAGNGVTAALAVKEWSVKFET